jgi:MoaA/NifB/PqqE/SkfB family radical SAM enzyme
MTRILSYFRTVHRRRKNLPDLPRFLTYTVTFRCNARCVMCDSWKKSSNDELSIQEVDRIFSQLPEMDAVRLTGGEPFLRSDLLEIMDSAQDKLNPFLLHITTNGLLTERIVRFCEQREKRRPLQLLVSIDGLEDAHDRIRGCSGAWDKAVRTIRELAPRRKDLNLRIAVNQTIVDAEGIAEYRRLHDLFGLYDIRVHAVLAYDGSAIYSSRYVINVAPTAEGEFMPFGSFRPLQLGTLLAEQDNDISDFPLVERIAKRYYWSGIQNRLLADNGYPDPRCVALNAHLRLFPDGRVPTCQFNTESVGNLRHSKFKDVWFGSLIAKQRSWVSQCPGCWAECEVIPNAVYSGDFLKFALQSGLKRHLDPAPQNLAWKT